MMLRTVTTACLIRRVSPCPRDVERRVQHESQNSSIEFERVRENRGCPCCAVEAMYAPYRQSHLQTFDTRAGRDGNQ